MVWEMGEGGRLAGGRGREKEGSGEREGREKERGREREAENRLATGSKQGHVNYEGKGACYSVNSKILL